MLSDLLTATSTNFFDFGQDIDYEWHLRYTFDETTKAGTIGFICDEIVATLDYGGQHMTWCWLGDNGQQYTSADVTANWSLVNDKFPEEIVFPKNTYLWCFCYSNEKPWDAIHNIKMTKKK